MLCHNDVAPFLGVLRSTLMVLCLAVFVPATGCQPPETRLSVLAFKSPSEPILYSEKFDSCVFCVEGDRDWTLLFEIPPVWVDNDDAVKPPETAPPPESDSPIVSESPSRIPPPESSDLSEGAWMSQVVHVEVFWKPRPGTTYAESTQTNSMIRYFLLAGEEIVIYEGAGFVYFSKSFDGKTITGQIESASLEPARTGRKPSDLFGPCRLKGNFVAHEDRSKVVSVLQDLQKKLGRVRRPSSLAINDAP